MSGPLQLVRLVLDRRELLRGVSRRGGRAHDEGYLLHAGLALLFAEGSERAQIPLHNFAVDDTYADAVGEREALYVLAYSDLDEGALTARMNREQTRLVRGCRTREVPPIGAGTTLTFRLRACPVVRTKRPGLEERGGPAWEPKRDAKGRARPREVDAWLVHRMESWQEKPPRELGRRFERTGAEWQERELIYGRWLARELDREGASQLVEPARMTEFERVRFFRKGGAGRAPERPDAILEGVLRVADDVAFAALLRRGVGRHRAFGYGMLLVRRA